MKEKNEKLFGKWRRQGRRALSLFLSFVMVLSVCVTQAKKNQPILVR